MTSSPNNLDTRTMAAPAASPLPAPSASEKPFVSAGQIVHREFTYRGVDWLLNSSFGVGFSVWSSRTQMGREWFSEPVQAGFRKILSPVMKNSESLDGAVKWGQNFISIMAGGTAMMPIITALEKRERKKAIIKSLDEKFYGKDVVAQDPKFQAEYDAIDREPQKGFWAGNGARLLALSPLLAMTVTAPIHNRLSEYFYQPISKGSKWIAGKMGIAPKGFMQEGKMVGEQFQSNWDYMHEQIGFDFGLTVVYSVLHEFVYKGMAKFFSDRKEAKAEARAQRLEAASLKPAGNNQEALEAVQPEARMPDLEAAPRTQVRYAEHQERVETRALSHAMGGAG